MLWSTICARVDYSLITCTSAYETTTCVQPLYTYSLYWFPILNSRYTCTLTTHYRCSISLMFDLLNIKIVWIIYRFDSQEIAWNAMLLRIFSHIPLFFFFKYPCFWNTQIYLLKPNFIHSLPNCKDLSGFFSEPSFQPCTFPRCNFISANNNFHDFLHMYFQIQLILLSILIDVVLIYWNY